MMSWSHLKKKTECQNNNKNNIVMSTNNKERKPTPELLAPFPNSISSMVFMVLITIFLLLPVCPTQASGKIDQTALFYVDFQFLFNATSNF